MGQTRPSSSNILPISQKGTTIRSAAIQQIQADGSWETKVEAGGGAAAASMGKYLPGVGSQGNTVLKVLGNAFGDGIAEPIIRGYTFLSRVFGAGDKIIITGFSRGATAARALAGFIAVRGLLDHSRYNANDKDAAYMRAISAWYAYRAGRPDFANQERLEWIQRRLDGGLPGLTKADYTAPLQIAAVGVFDTVSSLGLPHLDWDGNAVFDFSICDTTLNPNVQRGFHALAADETRDLFSPTYWAEREQASFSRFSRALHSNVGGGIRSEVFRMAPWSGMLANLETAGLVLRPEQDQAGDQNRSVRPGPGRRAESFPSQLRRCVRVRFPAVPRPARCLRKGGIALWKSCPAMASRFTKRKAPMRTAGQFSDQIRGCH